MQTPTSSSRSSKPIRRITVCCKTFTRFKSHQPALFPVLRLCGKWLQDSGFQIGHVVDIACEKGKLTITIAREQKYEQLRALFEKEQIEIV